MDDLKEAALRLLAERNEPEPARALTGCRISLRHASPTDDRPPGSRPRADVLIHAPGELLSDIRKGRPPCFDWGNQIERAIREVSAGAYDVRMIQWFEHATDGAPRSGTTGFGPSGGNAAA